MILALVPLSVGETAAASLACTDAAVEPVAVSRDAPVALIDEMRWSDLLPLELPPNDDRLFDICVLPLSPWMAASWSADCDDPSSFCFISGFCDGPEALPFLSVLW